MIGPMTPSERVFKLVMGCEHVVGHEDNEGTACACAACIEKGIADAVREEREALERLIIQYDKAGGIHVGKLLAAIRARTPASGEEI